MFPNVYYELFGELIYLDNILYYLCIIFGLAVSLFFVLPKITNKYGMSNKAETFYLLLAFGAVGAGFCGGILFQFIYDLFKYNFNLPAGYAPGMTFLGGLITGIAFFIIVVLLYAKPDVKSQFWIMLRVFAPCVCIAHAFGRIGCFFGGCCFGEKATGIFGIIYPAGSQAASALNNKLAVKVIPAQLIEAFFLFLLFAVFYFDIFNKLIESIIRKFQPQARFGVSLADKSMIIYLFAYGVFRFILEFFRGDDFSRGAIGALSPSQILCIGLVIAGGILAYLDKKKGLFRKHAPTDSSTLSN